MLLAVVDVFLDDDFFRFEVGVAQRQGDHKLTSTRKVAGSDGAVMQLYECS